MKRLPRLAVILVVTMFATEMNILLHWNKPNDDMTWQWLGGIAIITKPSRDFTSIQQMSPEREALIHLALIVPQSNFMACEFEGYHVSKT